MTTTRLVGLARLAKLSQHIRSGDLAHKNFDFSVLNEDCEAHIPMLRHNPNYCGTNGCALGECPALWPDVWQWRDGLTYGDDISNSLPDGAQEFFCLSDGEVLHIFYPDQQSPDRFGGEVLSETATREEVADNMDIFIVLALAKLDTDGK